MLASPRSMSFALAGPMCTASVLTWLVAEGALVLGLIGVQRGIGFCQALLRVLLSQRVNTMILEKALTL